jgi:hypothetical protein
MGSRTRAVQEDLAAWTEAVRSNRWQPNRSATDFAGVAAYSHVIGLIDEARYSASRLDEAVSDAFTMAFMRTGRLCSRSGCALGRDLRGGQR